MTRQPNRDGCAAFAGAGDVGPDTSAATANLLTGEAIRSSLSDKTLRYADNAPDGPYMMRFNADGTASLTRGPARTLAYRGKWWIDGSRLCRGWDRFSPRFDCWPVAISDRTISLYAEHDTMFIQGSIETE